MKVPAALFVCAFAFTTTTFADASGPWTTDYMSVMTKMDSAMKQAASSDPDVVFASKMIPHHQGAINMAKIELKYGKDSKARQEAENIILENEKSIKKLQAFIASHARCRSSQQQTPLGPCLFNPSTTSWQAG